MRVGVLGHFGEGLTMLNGQTIKSNNLVSGIEKYTDVNVLKIDSHGWMKKPTVLLANIKNAFCYCDSIIMLPAHNGIRVFSPLLYFFKKRYKKKIFYDVIGGWLPDFLDSKPWLTKVLKEFDGIWVETNTMKQKLEQRGFSNVTVIPNFKNLQPLTEAELRYPHGIPLKLCTFSRVMKEKGIEAAVDAVKAVNEELGYQGYCLDIYGQVNEADQPWFEALSKRLPEAVRYCGCVDSAKSVEVLRDYYALLFPTYYEGEGLAGTLIDAYCAGVPIIATDWRYNRELVTNETGYLFPTGNQEEFVRILEIVARNPSLILDKKKSCLVEANKYRAEYVLSQITEQLCK